MTAHFPALTPALMLAEEAREGLRMVASGEEKAIEGWLRYGAALHGGRKLHPGDLEFGRWMRHSNLEEGVDPRDQAAALWAAKDPYSFASYRIEHPRVRTVRGLWAKFNEAKREAAKPKAYETPTEKVINKVKAMRARADHPTTPEGDREACRLKLREYEERFGPDVGATKAGAKTTTNAKGNAEVPKSRDVLAHEVTKMALKRATKDKGTFELIEFAIRTTYGSIPGSLEKIFRNLNDGN